VKVLALLVTVTVAVVGAAGPGPAAPATEDRTVSCTHDGVTWTASYTWWVSPDFGPLVKVDGLQRTDEHGTVDASDMTWEWRLESLPAQQPAPGEPGIAVGAPYRSALGPLGPASPDGWLGAEWQSAFHSPRLVPPDGRCTLYLTPYANQGGTGGWPRVAVLGDSLLVQLNDSAFNQTAFQGYVEGDLNDDGTLVEVEGQSGRGWAPAGAPGSAAHAQQYLVDEMRGLTIDDVAGVVVALGANDAVRIAGVPAGAARDGYRDEVYGAIYAGLAEAQERAGCLALVTAPEHPTGVWGADYDEEVRAINDILRYVAWVSPTDDVHVVDFAAMAAGHPFGGGDAWFVYDGLHLNWPGRDGYRSAIRQAADLCTS
jgi:hypothetical protein